MLHRNDFCSSSFLKLCATDSRRKTQQATHRFLKFEPVNTEKCRLGSSSFLLNRAGCFRELRSSFFWSGELLIVFVVLIVSHRFSSSSSFLSHRLHRFSSFLIVFVQQKRTLPGTEIFGKRRSLNTVSTFV